MLKREKANVSYLMEGSGMSEMKRREGINEGVQMWRCCFNKSEKEGERERAREKDKREVVGKVVERAVESQYRKNE